MTTTFGQNQRVAEKKGKVGLSHQPVNSSAVEGDPPPVPDSSKVAAAVVDSAIRHCDNCDAVRELLDFTEFTADGRMDWRLCFDCLAKRRKAIEDEQELMRRTFTEIERIYGKWLRMDRHEAYEALQALSLEVLTA